MDKAKDFEKGWEEYKAKSKQEIEELEKDIVRSAGLGVHEKAKYLYDLDYRKIPENAVVLTREEYQMLNYFNHRGEELLKQERKETAEKLARRLKEKLHYDTIPESGITDERNVFESIDEIEKEFTGDKKCQECQTKEE